MNNLPVRKGSHIIFAIIGIIASLQWLHYNMGSTGLIDGIMISSFTVTVITMLSSVTAWLMMSWAHAGSNNKIKISNILNLTAGTLAGLLLIPSLVGWVGPMAGIILGIFAGLSCYVAFFIKNKESIEGTRTTHVVIRGVVWYAVFVIPLNFWFVYSVISFK